MKRSAGIVITKRIGNAWKFLMLRAFQYWDFPKGEFENESMAREAAIREVFEETGIKEEELNIIPEICYLTSPYGKHGKVAHYFFATTTANENIVLPVSAELGKPEHDEYRWVTFQEAMELPLCDRIRNVLLYANCGWDC